MILTKIQLSQFRNYKEKTFSFSKDLTLITGPNTSGKTSILEAIMLASAGKSFRADREREMIHNGDEVARVKALVKNKRSSDVVGIVLTPGVVTGKKTPYKQFKLNGVGKRQSSIVGLLPAVLFWPEDLYLIIGNPSGRRRYLDGVLSQTDLSYRRSLRSYEKALRVRNKLLHMIRESVLVKQDELVYWEEQLISHGTLIHTTRNQYIVFINSFDPSNDSLVHFHAVYDHSIVSRKRFDQYHHQERAAGVTLIGPHRDDIAVYKGKKENDHEHLKKFGSRGEQRLGVLWLKLAELSYISKKLSVRPLLLLDDILSELDETHRKLVLSTLSNQQTIITTADDDSIPHKIKKNAQVITLKLP